MDAHVYLKFNAALLNFNVAPCLWVRLGMAEWSRNVNTCAVLGHGVWAFKEHGDLLHCTMAMQAGTDSALLGIDDNCK